MMENRAYGWFREETKDQCVKSLLNAMLRNLDFILSSEGLLKDLSQEETG